MRGLHEQGHLRTLDVISAVSGGSYALFWFYAHQLHPEKPTDQQLFAGRYREVLLDRSTFVGDLNIVYAATAVSIAVVGSGITAVSGGRSIVGSPLQDQYRSAIEKTFNGEHYSVWSENSFPTPEEMKEAVERHNLPVFVVNLTVMNGVAGGRDNWYERIFEVTPFWVGADAELADVSSEDNADFRAKFDGELSRRFKYFSDYVVASGAALSGEAVGGVGGYLLGLTSTDIGTYIEILRKSRRNPFRDLLFYLSDGGFTDNLGAFSLVRRLCQNITIVDAEYDPHYRFGAYFRLKSALREELQVELTVPDIDAVSERSQSRAGFDGRNPVMRGKIAAFPFRAGPGKESEPITLDVTYIKLSVDQDVIRGASGRAESWYGPLVLKLYTESNGKDFPQYPTTRQIYSRERFEAYLDLGYCTVRRYWPNRDSRYIDQKCP